MELKGRKIDAWGNAIFDKDGLIELLLCGKNISGELMVLDDPDIHKFNQLCKEWDHPQDSLSVYQEPGCEVEQWDEIYQSQWFIPEEIKNLDVLNWLLDKCSTTEQVSRVEMEWSLFVDHDMINVLKLMVFLVGYFKENNTVWGVGRGSCVSSYILFLIGVHLVDSIKFDLDIHEFLK